jgi:hypothetical protein
MLRLTHVGGKLCGFIHSNNVQYVVFIVAYIKLKWQFDNPPPCKKIKMHSQAFISLQEIIVYLIGKLNKKLVIFTFGQFDLIFDLNTLKLIDGFFDWS